MYFDNKMNFNNSTIVWLWNST